MKLYWIIETKGTSYYDKFEVSILADSKHNFVFYTGIYFLKHENTMKQKNKQKNLPIMFPWEVLAPSNSRQFTGPLDTNGKAWKTVPDVGGQCSQDAQQEPKLLENGVG